MPTGRNTLYMFRHSKRLSQSEIAKIIGCSRATYSAIETGARNGTMSFWCKFQAAFNIADTELGGLMRVDTTGTRPIDRGGIKNN